MSGVVHTSPQTPERIALSGGWYLEAHWVDAEMPGQCERYVDGYSICSPDGKLGTGFMVPRTAHAFAAAMRPVEASPLPGDEEVAQEVIKGYLADATGFESGVATAAARIARHREQATASLRGAAQALIDRYIVNQGGNEFIAVIDAPLTPAPQHAHEEQYYLWREWSALRKALAAHPTKADQPS